AGRRRPRSTALPRANSTRSSRARLPRRRSGAVSCRHSWIVDMPYLLNAGKFLIETVFGFLIVVFLLRTMLIAVGASFYEPICQFVYKLSNPVVTPLRRFVPRWRNIEFASLLVAWLLTTLETTLLLVLFGLPLWFFGLLPYGLVAVLDWIILIELA